MGKVQGKGKHPLQVRLRHNDYSDFSDFYDTENVVLTHEWNSLSIIIPVGEQFFIRSVRNLAHKAKDPILKEQIKGFIGQEAMHAKETDRSLEPYEKRGFPVRELEQWFEKIIWKIEGFFPASWCLAATAGVEHYTAVLSIWHLGTRYTDRFPPSLRNLIQWHGAEELEHKSVAFDLYKEISPHNYLVRVLGFLFGMGITWYGWRKALKMFLKSEGLTRAQIRKETKKARKIRFPLISLRFPYLFAYLRPGFHPDDLDDGHLSKQVLAEQARQAAQPAQVAG